MKIMKNILIFVLCISLALSAFVLSSCDQEQNEEIPTEAPATEAPTKENEEEEPAVDLSGIVGLSQPKPQPAAVNGRPQIHLLFLHALPPSGFSLQETLRKNISKGEQFITNRNNQQPHHSSLSGSRGQSTP